MQVKTPYDLYDKQAVVAQAMAHPVRIAILNVLRQGPHNVQDIVFHICCKQSNVSRHLGLMVRAGLLASEKKGLHVQYRIKTPCVLKFLDCLGQCLKEQVRDDRKLMKMLT